MRTFVHDLRTQLDHRAIYMSPYMPGVQLDRTYRDGCGLRLRTDEPGFHMPACFDDFDQTAVSPLYSL
jgi:hypothetical protein